MNFASLDTSLMVSVGVIAVIALTLALYFYDSVEEAKEKRLKWLLRKRLRNSGTISLRSRWKQELLGNRRDLLVAVAVAALSALIFLILEIRLSFVAILALGVLILTTVLLTHLNRSRERKAFENSFPEAVEMLTRSVKTGVPLDEAFLSLAERFEGELSRRFDIFQSELALGKPFRDAGVTFCKGLNMPDVEFFFAVLSLNRESGSELTPTLEAMSYTLRERQKIRRKAVVLTSEIRSSAKVMAALPFAVAGIMFFINPGMTDFYLHDFAGQIVLGFCILSIVIGLMIIRDIANIDD